MQSSITYKDGIRSGPFKLWRSNTNMEEEGFYRNDSLHGQVKRWYSTGDPASVSHYKNGKLDSLMQVYSLSFELKKESFFKADNEIARIEYFEDNKIKEIAILDEDSILFQRSWNESGVEETDEVFITGTRKESEFFLNGNLQYECTYKGKNKHGIEWWFDEQRNPLKINFHLNGKTLISHEIQYN